MSDPHAFVVVRVLIFGAASVGKTALRRAICGKAFSFKHQPTFLNTHDSSIDLNGAKVPLQVWEIDDSSQRRLHQPSVPLRDGARCECCEYCTTAQDDIDGQE